MQKSLLIEQLETLPAFVALKKGLEKNLSADNWYVNHFMADAEQGERDEDGKLHRYTIPQEKREEQAIDCLLDDNGDYFDEFVHDDNIRNDITELMRTIIKECRQCGIC